MTTDFRRLLVAVTVAAYALLLAGTAAGWLVPQVRVLNVVGMAFLVAWWISRLLRGMDRVDMATVLLVVGVGISTAFSILTRLSIEAFFGCIAFASVFGASRRLEERDRLTVLRALRLLTAVLATALVIMWGGTWLRWLDLTGTLPPLSLRLPGAPFGHPHDAALLVGLMAPSLLATRMAGGHWLHNLGVGVTVVAVAALLFMNGARAIWGATFAATLVAIAWSGRLDQTWTWVRSHWIRIGAVCGIVAIVAVATGLTGTIGNRLLTTVSLDQRLAIWGSALESWLNQPITGTGPGTLQFSLQATDYFDRAVHAPEHADNLYVQVLAELGIVGAAALAVLAMVVVLAWRRERPPVAAVAALAFALVVSLGANPSALGYCALLIAFWAGMATPWRAHPAVLRRRRSAASLATASLLLGAVPVVLATSAAVAFDAARGEALAGHDDRAMATLDTAVALDPAFPLYRRARGVHLLNLGRADTAHMDLERAARLNPLDDTSWRSLAIAALAAGDVEASIRAAETAVGLQWTDGMNHATLAHVAGEVGNDAAAAAARDLGLTARWATADPAWLSALPHLDPDSAVQDAAEGVHRLDDAELDPRWVTAIAGRYRSIGGASAESQRAMALLVQCDLDGATAALAESAVTELGSGDYWIVRIILSGLRGEAADSARGALRIMAPLAQGRDPAAGSPVSDGLVDEASYSRRPITVWKGVLLPSNRAGLQAWLDQPREAVAAVRDDGGCA